MADGSPASITEAVVEPFGGEEFKAFLDLVWPRVDDEEKLSQVQKVWGDQAFTFPAAQDCNFGFIQKRNGPCGILSLVEAHMVMAYVWSAGASAQGVHELDMKPLLDLTGEAREHLLLLAIGNLIWSVAQKSSGSSSQCCATVVLPSAGTPLPTPPSVLFKDENCLELHRCPTREAVHHAICSRKQEFLSEDGKGVLLCLYSLVLCRGVKEFRSDASEDRLFSTIIFEDACMEQALVNLALTGQARCTILDSGWADWKGMVDIGFLTVEEEFVPAEHFKAPRFPVWIVHGGGHYTVLWSSCPYAGRLHPFLAGQPVEAQHPASTAELPKDAAAKLGYCKAGCGFHGSKEYLGYCSKCYKNLSEDEKESAQKEQHAQEASTDTSAATKTSSEKKEEPQPEQDTKATAAMAILMAMYNLSQSKQAEASTAEASPVDTFQFFHFNGLKPLHANGRPVRLAEFSVSLHGRWKRPNGPVRTEAAVTSSATEEESKKKEELAKALKIKHIVQHRVLPGGSKDDGPFEVLVACEKDGRLEGGLAPLPPGKWRCRDCHLQTPIVWSAYNDEDSTVCKECSKDRSECGYCHWVPLDEIPAGQRLRWLRNHAPAMTRLLRVRWPQSEADYQGNPPPAMWG